MLNTCGTTRQRLSHICTKAPRQHAEHVGDELSQKGHFSLDSHCKMALLANRITHAHMMMFGTNRMENFFSLSDASTYYRDLRLNVRCLPDTPYVKCTLMLSIFDCCAQRRTPTKMYHIAINNRETGFHVREWEQFIRVMGFSSSDSQSRNVYSYTYMLTQG